MFIAAVLTVAKTKKHHAAVLTVAKTKKHHECPLTEEWIKKKEIISFVAT